MVDLAKIRALSTEAVLDLSVEMTSPTPYNWHIYKPVVVRQRCNIYYQIHVWRQIYCKIYGLAMLIPTAISTSGTNLLQYLQILTVGIALE